LLREHGLGIRRQRFLELYRDLRGIEKKRETIKYVPRKYAPSRNLFVELPEEAMKSRYRYVLRYDVMDKEGNITSRYFSVRTNRYMSVGEMQDIVGSKVKDYERKYENKLIRMLVEQAFHRKGEMWD